MAVIARATGLSRPTIYRLLELDQGEDEMAQYPTTEAVVAGIIGTASLITATVEDGWLAWLPVAGGLLLAWNCNRTDR